MATIDQPAEWILRLFEMETREGRGVDCVRFPEGSCPSGIPLDAGERVYGVYKNKYYFTPQAFIILDSGKAQRIVWADVRSCSSRHGEGNTVSEVTWRTVKLYASVSAIWPRDIRAESPS